MCVPLATFVSILLIFIHIFSDAIKCQGRQITSSWLLLDCVLSLIIFPFGLTSWGIFYFGSNMADLVKIIFHYLMYLNPVSSTFSPKLWEHTTIWVIMSLGLVYLRRNWLLKILMESTVSKQCSYYLDNSFIFTHQVISS